MKTIAFFLLLSISKVYGIPINDRDFLAIVENKEKAFQFLTDSYDYPVDNKSFFSVLIHTHQIHTLTTDEYLRLVEMAQNRQVLGAIAWVVATYPNIEKKDLIFQALIASPLVDDDLLAYFARSIGDAENSIPNAGGLFQSIMEHPKLEAQGLEAVVMSLLSSENPIDGLMAKIQSVLTDYPELVNEVVLLNINYLVKENNFLTDREKNILLAQVQTAQQLLNK